MQTPTQRRLLLDFPFTVRSAFLLYADGSRSVEMEDLSEIQQPKQKFAKAVRYAVFAYGERRPEAQPSIVEGKPDSPIPDLPTDVTFPALSADVPAEVRRAIARVQSTLDTPLPRNWSDWHVTKATLPHTSSRPFASLSVRPATASNHHKHHHLLLHLLL